MVPSKVRPLLLKPDVMAEEKNFKDEVVKHHVEKIQDLQICGKHSNEISTLVLERQRKLVF
jgi:hypothetical protein